MLTGAFVLIGVLSLIILFISHIALELGEITNELTARVNEIEIFLSEDPDAE